MVKMIGFPSLLFFNIAKMSFNLDNLKLFLVVFVVQFSVHILIFMVSRISKKSDRFSKYISYTLIFGFNEYVLQFGPIVRFINPQLSIIPIMSLIGNNFIFIPFFKYLSIRKSNDSSSEGELSNEQESPQVEPTGNPEIGEDHEKEEEDLSDIGNDENDQCIGIFYKLLITPSNCMTLIGVIWNLIGIPIPNFVSKMLIDYERIVFPSGLIACSLELSNYSDSNMLSVFIVICFHYIVLPIIMLLWTYVFSLSAITRQLCVLMCVSPVSLLGLQLSARFPIDHTKIRAAFFWTNVLYLPFAMIWVIILIEIIN